MADDVPADNGAKSTNRRRLVSLLHKAAAQAVHEEDPWVSFDIPAVPAERIIRHLYDPHTQTWSTEETIVKMESVPFTHGAMRFCYRMKKRATPPMSATNHRFHKMGWSCALNYVSKAYQIDGEVDTSEAAKASIQNDILLQYEAQRWAERFNNDEPPTKIHFIRAYAVEFPNREGSPLFAVERFIAGTDSYGAGFVKHNTNSGYVDTEVRRVTPQVFSAHSFYASEGDRLVADIQGVGDLYTDPQVLSSDYRFGDGDLGPRGMALFFCSFRHSIISDSMGIPIFPLSNNEVKHQAKYCDDEETNSCSTGGDLSYTSHDKSHESQQDVTNSFQKLDLNRMRRQSSLMAPGMEITSLKLGGGNDVIQGALQEISESDFDNALVGTEKRSNMTTSRDNIRASMRQSRKSLLIAPPKPIKHTESEMEEVERCLSRARQDFKTDLVRDYHRDSAGALRERKFKNNAQSEHTDPANQPRQKLSNKMRHQSTIIGVISEPMKMTERTRFNLGKVHYQLAILHGMGRFPDIVPETPSETTENESDHEETPPHDSFSVLFHLSHAASFQNAPACLSLGRVHAGLGTHVSELLRNPFVPLEFEAAKDLLRRALEAAGPKQQDTDDGGLSAAPMTPRVAAGCLLFQILQDERLAGTYEVVEEADAGTASTNVSSSLTELISVAEDTLTLFKLMDKQHAEAEKVKECLGRTGMVAGTGNKLQAGDRVEGDYCMEGTYYAGTVLEVTTKEHDDGAPQFWITVQYDDDGSSETLRRDHVKMLIPPTATQSSLGGPLSDAEAFGGAGDDQDDELPIKAYELMSELAELKVEVGEREAASMLYQKAGEGAMRDNKIKTATEWSLKAAELLD
mmetsp:Transcript_44732/g.52420  ORF Transcript_44732/g.52420 Transcript_44732/m.52420 type:complete len:856 (+) Transcript_44732:130-2697(+)|eukprot:CAMPEP_0194390408 /NCGR_PEP_ID=MMETSP0174-20130528/109982_1 /TAXON_ID=216777 /ORGANISM="Proboscia alata, Strain PI-D3" /LENGTH=855 /DNA_ID=CAMNT_0039183755 /DNA_START=83 /DNA_END=2650 /DNA_ORIENTATION=+